MLATYRKVLDPFHVPPGKRIIDARIALRLKPGELKAGQVWVGYSAGTFFEAHLSVWTWIHGNRVFLGGVYLHKHQRNQVLRSDFYVLEHLRDLKPIRLDEPTDIEIVRDIANMDPLYEAFAWDCELILTSEQPDE